MGEPRNLTEWSASDVALDLEDALYMTNDAVFGDDDGLSYSPDHPRGSALILYVRSTNAPDGPTKRFLITVTELGTDAPDTAPATARRRREGPVAATAPRDLILTQQILETEHHLDFLPAHQGGTWWALVSETTGGTWIVNNDFGIAWYPGKTWHDDGALPTHEDYFDVEYDDETGEVSNLAEFAAWAAEQMTAAEHDANTKQTRETA
jgi:hypothetical protein